MLVIRLHYGFSKQYSTSLTYSEEVLRCSCPTAQAGELRLRGNRRFQALRIKEETPGCSPSGFCSHSGPEGLHVWKSFLTMKVFIAKYHHHPKGNTVQGVPTGVYSQPKAWPSGSTTAGQEALAAPRYLAFSTCYLQRSPQEPALFITSLTLVICIRWNSPQTGTGRTKREEGGRRESLLRVLKSQV